MRVPFQQHLVRLRQRLQARHLVVFQEHQLMPSCYTDARVRRYALLHGRRPFVAASFHRARSFRRFPDSSLRIP